MDPINKVKILKMLMSYLSCINNVKLFYDHLIHLNIEYAFECLGYFEKLKIVQQNGGSIYASVESLFQKLKTKQLIWKDSLFENMLRIEQEEDDFLETPLEIAEGAIKCKCGSERVFSFSKQTRSGDESTTVFALCSSCKSKWVL